jgi:hypothetical protein
MFRDPVFYAQELELVILVKMKRLTWSFIISLTIVALLFGLVLFGTRFLLLKVLIFPGLSIATHFFPTKWVIEGSYSYMVVALGIDALFLSVLVQLVWRIAAKRFR